MLDPLTPASAGAASRRSESTAALQSDVAAGQPWTLTPKWPVPGSGEVDAALGKFRFDETGKLTGEPLVMVELKGARTDLDRKMPIRNNILQARLMHFFASPTKPERE